jgi:hypothetical protein
MAATLQDLSQRWPLAGWQNNKLTRCKDNRGSFPPSAAAGEGLDGSSSGGIRQRGSRNGVSVTSQDSPEVAAWDSRPGAGSLGEGHIQAGEGGNTRYNKSSASVLPSSKRAKRLTPGAVRIAETFLWVVDARWRQDLADRNLRNGLASWCAWRWATQGL